MAHTDFFCSHPLSRNCNTKVISKVISVSDMFLLALLPPKAIIVGSYFTFFK